MPSLAALAGVGQACSALSKQQLARVWNEHTRTGEHRSRQTAFPKWVPRDVLCDAQRLSVSAAEQILLPWLQLGRTPGKAKAEQHQDLGLLLETIAPEASVQISSASSAG